MRSRLALLLLGAITLAGVWLRVRAVPGPWGTDALRYVELACGGGEGAADPRSQRVAFIHLVRAGLALGGGTPAAASLPGVVLSALVGPVLWAGLRRRCGDLLALFPAAVWAVLGLDVEEVVEVSADAVLALPGAFVALALCAAAARPERANRWMAAAGVVAGAAIVTKETFLLPAVGLLAGALVLGAPGRRLALAARVVGGALPVLALAAAGGWLQRPDVISHGAADAPHAILPHDAGFLRRLTIGVPVMLLTTTGAFGLLHVAALPLLARLPFRAARGDALAAAALASMAAYWLAPVSLEHWGVLTTQFPRFLLPLLPVWIAALGGALADAHTSPWERRASLAAAVAGLAFVGAWRPTWVLVPLGLAATAFPCLPAGWRVRVPVFPASVVAARAVGATVLTIATASSLFTPWARTRPDATWTAWSVLPREGRVHADVLLARRLAFAARTATAADASRLHPFDGAPPAAPAPGDVVLVRRGTGAAAACAARPDLAPLGADLGEAVPYRAR